jgi:hypothetical protein
MRTIAHRSGQLLLNGRSFYLRGALDQDYYHDLVYTPFSDSQLDAQFAQAQHMGLNCLRTHIKITDPRYYDAADRAGLLIWTELPNWQNLTVAATKRARATLAGMVERDWNHPSIVIWTIINENWGLTWASTPIIAPGWPRPTVIKRLIRTAGGWKLGLQWQLQVDRLLDFHNYYPDHYQNWRDWCGIATGGGPSPTATPISKNGKRLGPIFGKGPRCTAEVRSTGTSADRLGFGNWGRDWLAARRLRRNDPWWFRDRLGSRQRRGLPAWHRSALPLSISKGLPDAGRPDGSQRMQLCAEIRDRADAPASQHRRLCDHRVYRCALGVQRSAGYVS